MKMHWYLIHTKPRQETYALQQLQQQGYFCFLPTLAAEKIRQAKVAIEREPLFPRYLFVRLDDGQFAQSWVPIRSTRGVRQLVCFGNVPAKVDEHVVEFLRAREDNADEQPRRLFKPGEAVRLTGGVLDGFEGVYQMADGDRRALVLIEMMSKSISVSVGPTQIKKIN